MRTVVERDALVLQYRPLALRLAKSAPYPGEPDDLRQAALVGLILAAERFDPDKGPFAPYAVLCIRHEMQCVSLQTKLIRRCRHRDQISTEDEAAFETLASRVPSPEQALITRREVECALAGIETALSEIERNAVVLVRLEELRVAAAAARMGVGSKTVTNALQRVSSKLRAVVA